MKPQVSLPKNDLPIWLRNKGESASSAHNQQEAPAGTANGIKTASTAGCSALNRHVKSLENALYRVRHNFTVEPTDSIGIIFKRATDMMHRAWHSKPQATNCQRCEEEKRPKREWTVSYTPIASLTHH